MVQVSYINSMSVQNKLRRKHYDSPDVFEAHISMTANPAWMLVGLNFAKHTKPQAYTRALSKPALHSSFHFIFHYPYIAPICIHIL